MRVKMIFDEKLSKWDFIGGSSTSAFWRANVSQLFRYGSQGEPDCTQKRRVYYFLSKNQPESATVSQCKLEWARNETLYQESSEPSRYCCFATKKDKVTTVKNFELGPNQHSSSFLWRISSSKSRRKMHTPLGHCPKLSEWVVGNNWSLIGHLPATYWLRSVMTKRRKPTVSGGSWQKMTL